MLLYSGELHFHEDGTCDAEIIHHHKVVVHRDFPPLHNQDAYQWLNWLMGCYQALTELYEHDHQ